MSKGAIGFGAVLAAVGFAVGYATARFSPATPGRAAIPAARFEGDEARRAIAEQIRQPASIESAEQLAHLLVSLGPEAAPAIAPILVDPSETLDGPRSLLLVQFWADRDPNGAAEWATRRASPAFRQLMLAPAVARIAESDPQAALRYVGSGPMANTDLLKTLIHGWMRSGKPGLEDWVRDLGYGFKRQKALGAFARAKIARDGVAAAVAWFDALPASEDGFRYDAFWRMTMELTYADPTAGVAWYEKHRNGQYGSGLMTAVVGAWVAVDGPAAIRWASQQPADAERDEAVSDGVRRWGTADPESLKRWARAMGPDRIEDWFQPALPILARQLALKDPAEGIQWTGPIADESRRRLTLIQIAREWRRRDPAAAEAWLAQSPLTEEERARVVAVGEPRMPKHADIAPQDR